MVRTPGRHLHERVHDASEWTNASGLREFFRPYPRDRSWPTWPLGRVASGGSTQADRAQISGVERDQNPPGLGVDQRLRTQIYWSACRSNRMAPPALSKLRQHVFLPMTSRSECLVRFISPHI